MESEKALTRKIKAAYGKIDEILSEIQDIAADVENTCPFYLYEARQCAIALTLQKRGIDAVCLTADEDFSCCCLYEVGTGKKDINLAYEGFE